MGTQEAAVEDASIGTFLAIRLRARFVSDAAQQRACHGLPCDACQLACDATSGRRGRQRSPAHQRASLLLRRLRPPAFACCGRLLLLLLLLDGRWAGLRSPAVIVVASCCDLLLSLFQSAFSFQDTLIVFLALHLILAKQLIPFR